MAKNLFTPLVSELILFLVAIAAISSQEVNKPQRLPEQLPVYVVSFSQDVQTGDASQEVGGLGGFTSRLIDLRLMEISSVTVHRVPLMPVCGDLVPPPQGQSSNPNPSSLAPVIPIGDFYVVHGSIENHLPDIFLNYVVDKCESHKLVTMFQDTQAFTLNHALEEISSSAHSIAFKIVQAIPPTQIAVEPFKGDAVQQDQKDIMTGARNSVIHAISQSSDYKVVDGSDYVVEGQITLVRNPRLIRILPMGHSIIRADLKIRAHEKEYTLAPVSGSNDQLQQLYSEIDAVVLENLPQVLLAEHLKLPSVAKNMASNALLSEANQLLSQCSGADRDCARASAEDAIQLLLPATLRDQREWKVFMALGRAQIQAGKNVDAISSLETAHKLIEQDNKAVSNADHVQVLILLGDSYRAAGEYQAAEEKYSAALRLDSKQIELYRSSALALQFDNKRIEALDTIVQGLKLSNESVTTKVLHQLAVDIIKALQVSEFEKAEIALNQAFLAGVPVANEYALLTSRRCEQMSGTDSTPESRQKAKEDLKRALDRQPTDPAIVASVYGDLARAALLDEDHQQLKAFLDEDSQELKTFLDEADKLPSDQVPANTREWIKRLRAIDQLNNSKYEKAYEFADTAYHIEPTDYAASLAAEAMLLWARCKDTAWKLGKEEAGQEQCKRQLLLRDDEVKGSVNLTPGQELELKKMYQQAADRIAPLVVKRYQGGDFIFLRANHYLEQDNRTLEQFTRIVQKDPKDASALDDLIFVCSQYLFNFDCAFSAAQKSARLLDPTAGAAPEDYLNVAEMAVLKGDDKQATDWLTMASAQPHTMKPRDESLIYLYRLWVAMRKGQSDEFKTDFESWKEATMRFRDSKDNLGWVFRGARQALDHSSSVIGKDNAGLLASMMDALENNSQTLPAWPES